MQRHGGRQTAINASERVCSDMEVGEMRSIIMGWAPTTYHRACDVLLHALVEKQKGRLRKDTEERAEQERLIMNDSNDSSVKKLVVVT